MHKDLLIELDYQAGMQPSSAALGAFVAAYADANVPNLDGSPGINVHVFVDEQDLPVAAMQSDLNSRLNDLGAHGPKNISGEHAAKMVHVVFASARPDSPSRGGEMIASSAASAEKAGVLVYVEHLQAIFPTCNERASPAVTLEEATISTFVHEVGHTLQLGHDTDAGGGVNTYNIMATDLGSCGLLKQRTRGVGNTDPDLGATSGAAPRFSKAAAALMKLDNKISVEANAFENPPGGYDM